MPRNLGRMTLRRATFGGQPYGIPFVEGTDTLWKDHAEAKPGHVYLAVMPDGLIFSAGPDPAWNLLEGAEIWEVEGDDYESFFGKTWDGEKAT